MCWIPFVFMIISDIFNININIKYICLSIIVFSIIIIIISLKIEKNTKISEGIFAIIGLIFLIGYTIYSLFQKFI